MKFVVVLLGLLVWFTVGAPAEVPEGRVKLVDGHLVHWQTGLALEEAAEAWLWGREGGWASGAVKWGPLMMGPLRSVREDATPWDFRPDPAASSGVWGAVLGKDLPGSVWWLQSPQTNVMGAQAALSLEAFLASGGVQFDLTTRTTEYRGLLALGAYPAKAALWYADEALGLRVEARQGSGHLVASTIWSMPDGVQDWRLQAAVGPLTLGLEGHRKSSSWGGSSTVAWSEQRNLFELGGKLSPEQGLSLATQVRWVLSSVVVRCSAEANIAGLPWSLDLGCDWKDGATQWSVTTGTILEESKAGLPGGSLKIAMDDGKSRWKVAMELKAPGRVAQWLGSGNHVELVVSHGL